MKDLEMAPKVLKLQEVSDLEKKIDSLEQKITRMNDIYRKDLEKKEQEKKSLEEKLKGKTTLTKYLQALFKKSLNVLNTRQAVFDNHACKLAEYQETNNANLKIIYESQQTILKLEENTASC